MNEKDIKNVLQMTPSFSFNDYVHLAVDLEQASGLRGKDRTKFQQLIQTFASRISPSIKTILVGYSTIKEFKLYSKSMATRIPHLRNQHRISFPIPTQHRDIFAKGSVGAFDAPPLANHLRAQKIQTVVVTGMYAFGCVKDTVVGALNAGFNCIVITDLLHDGEPGGDPLRYENFYKKSAATPEFKGKLTLMTAAQFSQILPNSPLLSRPRNAPQAWQPPQSGNATHAQM